jgi:hypothetical protein
MHHMKSTGQRAGTAQPASANLSTHGRFGGRGAKTGHHNRSTYAAQAGAAGSKSPALCDAGGGWASLTSPFTPPLLGTPQTIQTAEGPFSLSNTQWAIPAQHCCHLSRAPGSIQCGHSRTLHCLPPNVWAGALLEHHPTGLKVRMGLHNQDWGALSSVIACKRVLSFRLTADTATCGQYATSASCPIPETRRAPHPSGAHTRPSQGIKPVGKGTTKCQTRTVTKPHCPTHT